MWQLALQRAIPTLSLLDGILSADVARDSELADSCVSEEVRSIRRRDDATLSQWPGKYRAPGCTGLGFRVAGAVIAESDLS